MNPFDSSIILTIDAELSRSVDKLRVHPERWFDSLRSLTIVLSVVEARMKGVEG